MIAFSKSEQFFHKLKNTIRVKLKRPSLLQMSPPSLPLCVTVVDLALALNAGPDASNRSLRTDRGHIFPCCFAETGGAWMRIVIAVVLCSGGEQCAAGTMRYATAAEILFTCALKLP